MATWYYARQGEQQTGPVAEDDLRALAASGALRPGDLVWRDGMAAWSAAGQALPALFAGGSVPPPLPVEATPVQYFQPAPPPPIDDVGQNAGMRWLMPVGRSPLAIAAGYLGLLSIIPIVAPAALIVGILAIRDIRRHPGRHGMGRAIFGVVMGVLGTLLLGFVILRAFA